MKRLIVLLIFFSGCEDEQCWAIKEECLLGPDPGPCKARIPKYYFDQEMGKCTLFYWGGCNGVVPFESLEACLTACDCE